MFRVVRLFSSYRRFTTNFAPLIGFVTPWRGGEILIYLMSFQRLFHDIAAELYAATPAATMRCRDNTAAAMRDDVCAIFAAAMLLCCHAAFDELVVKMPLPDTPSILLMPCC